MTGRLVVLAVALVAAIAAADTVRGREPVGKPEIRPPARAVVLGDAGGFTLAGRPRTRVLQRGRLYLSADEIRRAFPAQLEAVLFEIGHVAAAPDGKVALAIYNFGTAGPPRNAIQLWKGSRLLGSFPVPPGTFGGGIGFTSDGHVAARGPRGGETAVFDASGRVLGSY